MFAAHFFGARYFPPAYFGEGGTAAVSTASDYFANVYFPPVYFGPYYWGNPGSAVTTAATNSGVQRLRAYHEGQDSYYRDVARKEALQVQQIRLNELLAQRQEIEAERLRQEALRNSGATQRLEAKHSGTLAPNPALDDRIAALARDLADINGALVLTRAEIAQLDAIESWQALLDEDEAIIILAASM